MIGEIIETCLYIHVISRNAWSLLFLGQLMDQCAAANTLATQGQWIQFPRCKEKPSKGTCSFSGFVLLSQDRIPAVVPVPCCKGPWSCCWFVHRNRELLVQGDKWEMLRSTCVPQGAALEVELVCYVF